MPKICEPCRFYSTDNTPTASPTSGSGLRFTLLPPPGEAAAPLEGVESAPTTTARARTQKEGFLESLGISEINPRYIWIGFLILLSVGGLLARQYQMGQRLKSVQPGMHISEAARLIDANDDDGGYVDARMMRFRDNFGPNDRTSGAFEYEDGAYHMLIRWQNGIVTTVENKGASRGGPRRAGTITIVDGDD